MLVFINELLQSIKHSNIILFADYTAIYYPKNNKTETHEKINEGLLFFEKWLNDHRLMLNISKSTFTVIGRKQLVKRFQDLPLKIEMDELSCQTSYRYLGVIINEKYDMRIRLLHCSRK